MFGEIEEIKERIAASLTLDQFFDILGLELADIIDTFEEQIEDNYAQFKRVL